MSWSEEKIDHVSPPHEDLLEDEFPAPDELTVKQDEWLQGLRELFATCESNPAFQGMISEHASSLRLLVYCLDKPTFERNMRVLGGKRDKHIDAYANVTRRFGPHEVVVFTPREQVCERRVIGVTKVPARVIPEKDQEVVEWVCSDAWFNSEDGEP